MVPAAEILEHPLTLKRAAGLLAAGNRVRMLWHRLDPDENSWKQRFYYEECELDGVTKSRLRVVDKEGQRHYPPPGRCYLIDDPVRE